MAVLTNHMYSETNFTTSSSIIPFPFWNQRSWDTFNGDQPKPLVFGFHMNLWACSSIGAFLNLNIATFHAKWWQCAVGPQPRKLQVASQSSQILDSLYPSLVFDWCRKSGLLMFLPHLHYLSFVAYLFILEVKHGGTVSVWYKRSFS